MNLQGLQITNVAKSLLFEEVCLIFRTKETVPLIGPALLQMEPAQKKSDIWPNINQSASLLGVRVCDGNRGLQFAWLKGIVPLAEKFRED